MIRSVSFAVIFVCQLHILSCFATTESPSDGHYAGHHTLTVYNGSGDGDYNSGDDVEISAAVPSGYSFLRWMQIGGGGHVQRFAGDTKFTMPGRSAVIAAVFGKIESWFPPGPEDGTKGILLAKNPEAETQVRMEQRIRVSLDVGDASGELKVSEVWDTVGVKVDWFPSVAATDFWHSSKLVKYFDAKENGNEIRRDSAVPKSLFKEVSSGVYEATIWYEGAWTQAEAAEIVDSNGDAVRPEVLTSIELDIHGTNFATTRATAPGTLRPIELVDTKDGILDDEAPQGTQATASTQDVNIEPKKDASDKRPQTVAWIDPHGADNEKDPEMPWLTLRLRGTEELGLKIRWKLKVEYKRPNGRKLPEDKVMIPDAEGWVTENLDGAIEIYNHAKWIQEIEQKGYFGGEAELVFQLVKSNGAPLGDETKWSFYIGGKNPDPEKSRTFITEASNDIQPAMAWFAYAIAKHESKDYNGAGSRYNQFWNASGRYAKVDHHAGEVLWVNNPKEGPPKGFGLFQVTGNAKKKDANIPRKQIWNWQDNVRGGLAIVASKRGIAERYFARIQRRSAQHKTAFEDCPPPNIQVGTHTFSSYDAIQVYCYNGTGDSVIDGRYPFDPTKLCGLGADKRWFWNPHHVGKPREPYINKVEREFD